MKKCVLTSRLNEAVSVNSLFDVECYGYGNKDKMKQYEQEIADNLVKTGISLGIM